MKKDKLTNYRKAWIDYKKTPNYKELSDNLKKHYGIKQPYRDNIIQNAFGWGWKMTKKKIKFINEK